MIIDSHVHLPTPDYPEGGREIKGTEAAIERLRRSGTDAAIFNTWRGVYAATAQDVERGNRAALRIARRHPEFLYPGAVLSPFCYRESVEWLARFRDRGLLWVGELLPKSKPDCAYTDAPYLRLFEACARGGHIVQLHGTPHLPELARRFPEMQIVRSHVGTDEENRALAALPNTWLDLSGQRGGLWMGGMEGAAKTFGAERLLYGTDFSGYVPECFMVRVRQSFPAASDRRKVFSANVLRLLRRAGAELGPWAAA
jgi:predicted TIM-barrel fold metal-dependent hydrolase